MNPYMTDEWPFLCGNCGGNAIAYRNEHDWKRSYLAYCTDCYDGAIDSTQSLGAGPTPAEAADDYNEQFEERE